jgi:hypothetical protein
MGCSTRGNYRTFPLSKTRQSAEENNVQPVLSKSRRLVCLAHNQDAALADNNGKGDFIGTSRYQRRRKHFQG